MSIDSSADWYGLRAVSAVVSQTLALLTRSLEPGITTGELDAIAARFLESSGARSAPALVYGFPGTVLISVNEEVVHGVPGRRVIARGDLVSLDVTLELDGYVADAARSVIVGTGSPMANRLVRCAEEAFHAGLSVATAGVRVNEISRAVVLRQLDSAPEGRVHVDVSGYRQRRREALERFARSVAQEVVETGRAKALEPMSAADRKIVHDAVGEIEGVRTSSEGEEPARRVVISPAS